MLTFKLDIFGFTVLACPAFCGLLLAWISIVYVDRISSRIFTYCQVSLGVNLQHTDIWAAIVQYKSWRKIALIMSAFSMSDTDS